MLLYWAFIFLVIALIAGAFGFRSVEGVAASISKGLFVLFLILFILSIIAVIGIFS